MTQRQKRILRWVGYPLLALVTFAFAVHLTFPYERVKDRLVAAMADKYEVKVLDVKRTILPGGIILEGVSLTPRVDPSAAEKEGEEGEEAEPPPPLYIDTLRVDMGLLAALSSTADVDVLAEIGGGSIEGNINLSKAAVKAKFSTELLPLDNIIPGLKAAVGLPMKGRLNASVDLTLPEGRWDKAEGEIALSCPSCTIGDGKSKIKPKAPPGKRLRRSAGVCQDGNDGSRAQSRHSRGQDRHFWRTGQDRQFRRSVHRRRDRHQCVYSLYSPNREFGIRIRLHALQAVRRAEEAQSQVWQRASGNRYPAGGRWLHQRANDRQAGGHALATRSGLRRDRQLLVRQQIRAADRDLQARAPGPSCRARPRGLETTRSPRHRRRQIQPSPFPSPEPAGHP